MLSHMRPFVAPLIPAIPVVLVARAAFASPRTHAKPGASVVASAASAASASPSPSDRKTIIAKLEEQTQFQEKKIREEIYTQVDTWLFLLNPDLAKKTMPHLSPAFLNDMDYIRVVFDGNPAQYNAKKRHAISKELRDFMRRYTTPYETEILTMLCSHYGLI